jgi:general stress protein YciG
MRMDHIEYLRKIGAKGGAATKGITSAAKKKASRDNGKKGGRPKAKKPSEAALAKRRSRARLGSKAK